ncbi:MAG: DNA polymerase III subunit beta [Phycisphaerae bacterium]|nr:DNA polymerase III subunit beta [Phycisphaerae bacterium]
MLTAEQTATQTNAVELSRTALVTLLDRAKHVVPVRFPKPILTCVRLEIAEGLVSLQATDGELSLFAHMPADGSLPPCVVPLAELSRRLKASKHPACSLSLSEDGARLLINGGRVEHALQTYDPAEFPAVPSQLEGDSIEVDAAELVHALNVASHGVAKEASRYAIDGILLESNEKGSRLVATDGRRLVTVELRNAGELDGVALMPHRFCRLIEKLTDRDTDFLALAVHREKNEKGDALPGRVFAAGPDWLIATYECDGRFPVYRDVTPRSQSKFAIPRAALVETLMEVALTTNEESRMVRLDLGPQGLLLRAEAPGVGRSEARLPTEFLGGGDAMIRTAFNPAYLLDALKTLDSDAVVIDVGQNGYGSDRKVYSKPALISDRYDAVVRWVLMPVNAGLEATRENLGSNYPEHLDGDQEQQKVPSATEAA